MAGKRVGLVIGNNYPNSSKELKFAVADATKMKEILLDKNICYFDDVVLLINKTSRDVSTKLEEIFKNVHQNDLIFIYFSGHGIKDNTNNLRLFLEDTNEELLLTTSISFDFINECRKNSQALMASVIIVLDCCYSALAGMKDTDVAETIASHCSTGMVILTSTGYTGSRTAMEDGKLGYSFFTYYLIEGLEKGYADKDDDGKISIDELYDYAYEMTKKGCSQSPQKKGNIEGSVFIGINPLKIGENEYNLKVRKLFDEFGDKLPLDILSECQATLRKHYKKNSYLEKNDKVVLGYIEFLLKDDLLPETRDDAIQNCIEAIEHKKKKEKQERKHREEENKDKREEQEKLFRQKEETEKLEENKRDTQEEVERRKKEQETVQKEELCRQIEEPEQKQMEDRKKKDKEIFERKKIEKPLIYPHERINEVEQLESEFSLIRDKQLALSNFLHLEIHDENYCVRWAAVNVLESVFSYVSDKQQAWEDLIKLIVSDIHYKHGYNNVYALCSAFPHMPDKEQAWNDLQKLANDDEYFVRSGFLSALESAFPHIQDKQQAWEDLHQLTNDKHKIRDFYDVREYAASIIGTLFPQLPNKQQAWNDLQKLANGQNSSVRYRAISSIHSAFPYLPDKEQAWEDLHRFTCDKDQYIRREVAETIGATYPHLPDKEKAWEDLYKLIHDEENEVIGEAVEAIGAAFPHLPDKQKAWNELHKLAYGDSECFDYINYEIASAIGVAFPHLQDKQQAWEDLCKLAIYECCDGRRKAIEVLSSAFIHVPFKLHALNDLNELTKYGDEEEDSDIRAYAYQSLGDISIFNASKSKDDNDYKEELEKAITFFERAKQLDCCESPSPFYLYLFRTLHTMLFNKQESKENLNKYMRYTKSNVKHGKSNELLFKAVSNLTTALKQVQYLENKDFKIKENELKFYRKYFDYAEELITEAAEELPFAAETIRKGMFILDTNIKRILNNHLG